MATELKRIAAAVDDASSLLADCGADEEGFKSMPLPQSVAAELHSRTSQQLAKLLDLGEGVEKLRKKASELDPDKRVLGPKAAAAALQQCQQFDRAKEQLQKLIEFTSPVVDSIRKKQADEAAAAEAERNGMLELERQAAVAQAAAESKAAEEALVAAAAARAAAEAEAFEKAEKLRLYRETRSNVKEVFAKAAETGVLNQETVRAVMDGKEKHELSKAWVSLPLGSGFVDIELALRMEDMCSKMKKLLVPALDRFTIALAREGFTVLHEALRTVVMCPLPLYECPHFCCAASVLLSAPTCSSVHAFTAAQVHREHNSNTNRQVVPHHSHQQQQVPGKHRPLRRCNPAHAGTSQTHCLSILNFAGAPNSCRRRSASTSSPPWAMSAGDFW
jgi:hypothetical protein